MFMVNDLLNLLLLLVDVVGIIDFTMEQLHNHIAKICVYFQNLEAASSVLLWKIKATRDSCISLNARVNLLARKTEASFLNPNKWMR